VFRVPAKKGLIFHLEELKIKAKKTNAAIIPNADECFCKRLSVIDFLF
jgi:hypothetical protein